MNKMYLEIIVPMLELEFDIKCPPNKTFEEFSYLISKAINELSDDYFPAKSINIYDKFTGKLYQGEAIIKELGIKNGDKLIIV